MLSYPRLNFPAYSFRMRSDGGQERVWDDIRKTWLVLTPEEWVRQHLVRWLSGENGVPPQLITQEYPVCLSGQPQRADVVVFGRDGKPLLLAECKEPACGIAQSVLDQAVRYNSVLKARYVMLTNGMKHYIYEAGADGGYTPLESFPELKG